jgi:cell surface protein SprA
MNSFNSQLNYADPSRYGQPGFIDTLTGNYVPYFQVPNVTITEQFSPLIDIDMQFVNHLTAKFGIIKSRQLSLSLIDFQLSETRTTELTLGGGWQFKNVPLPFHMKMPVSNTPGKKVQNDLTLRLVFGIRQQTTSSSFLDQGSSLPTAGQTVINIDPSIDYVLNNRLNRKFYFDQARTTPTISTSPPTITTKMGLQVRISLAP